MAETLLKIVKMLRIKKPVNKISTTKITEKIRDNIYKWKNGAAFKFQL